MKNNSLVLILLFVNLIGFTQEYEFETTIDLEATDVISQGNTGTCWSFSTSSFLESEIMRLTGKKIDISEMFTVRHTYPKKAWTYVMRQGHAQFSEGGLGHDVINSVSEFGVVPNEIYTGLLNNEKKHSHSKMTDSIKTILKAYINDRKSYTSNLQDDVNAILDAYLGDDIKTFSYDGVRYTPKSFLEMTKINPSDYVSITSFSHEPYYSEFILDIPDNFANGSFFNVPLDELTTIANYALRNGFTIELDCDVSEQTFSSKHGIAVVPENEDRAALIKISPEKRITEAYRQEEFENYNTTDDHLMHITGMLKDQKGTKYYKVKNSWGTSGVGHDGYVYMSEAYFKLKTISIMVHKDAIPNQIKTKLLLK
ncbi:MAG: C1 family peptidase [Psychroserpens sp.]|uniref:C1 family peptidase n=1 Tax=Psychroserpens sp. TaxID=2020870 RepID=UPI003C70C49A